jgi:hypothetical protein
MKTDLYTQVQDMTGQMPTKRIFYSVRLYLQEYKDTSRSKAERLKSLKAADTLIDWVISDVLKYSNDDIAAKMFSMGVYNISNNIKGALAVPSKLVDMQDAIGFLLILEN